MNGRELIFALRESKLDDLQPPYLWQDAELLRFLNYAEVQACRRAHLLIDWATASDSGTAGTSGVKPLCLLPVLGGTATYHLSPKILQIKRCQLKSMTYPLTGPVSYPQLDDAQPGWWGTSGTVATAGGYPAYFINEPVNTITFVPSPSVDDTAYLVVSRIPLLPFTLQTSPEVEEKYHEGLLDWAAHLAFMKPDAETINLNLAQIYDQKFIQQFGTLPDAYSEKMRKTLSQKERMRPRAFGS